VSQSERASLDAGLSALHRLGCAISSHARQCAALATQVDGRSRCSFSPVIHEPHATTMCSANVTLSMLFSASGAWPESSYHCSLSTTHERQFNETFGVFPSKFLCTKLSICTRCEENGVQYVEPCPTDGRKKTIARRRALNRAIKMAKQKQKREDMSYDEQQ